VVGARRCAWGRATTAWAVAQAAAAYGYSYLFSQSGSYVLLFALGTVALVTALLLDLAVAAASRPRHGEMR
jgi:hypothetical protein